MSDNYACTIFFMRCIPCCKITFRSTIRVVLSNQHSNVQFEFTQNSHHKRGIASRRADVCRHGAIISPSGQLFVLASGEGLQHLPRSVVSAAPATLHLQAPPGQ